MTIGEFLNLMDKLDITVEAGSVKSVADFYSTDTKCYTPLDYDEVHENLDNYEYLSCCFYADGQDPSIYCKKIK